VEGSRERGVGRSSKGPRKSVSGEEAPELRGVFLCSLSPGSTPIRLPAWAFASPSSRVTAKDYGPLKRGTGSEQCVAMKDGDAPNKTINKRPHRMSSATASAAACLRTPSPVARLVNVMWSERGGGVRASRGPTRRGICLLSFTCWKVNV